MEARLDGQVGPGKEEKSHRFTVAVLESFTRKGPQENTRKRQLPRIFKSDETLQGIQKPSKLQGREGQRKTQLGVSY